MNYAENLWIFIALLFGIIIVPGMDMLYVMTNALTGGRRAGFAAVSGIMLGGMVHTLTGTLGVGVLSFVMPWLRDPLILVGAAYMGWIGYGLIRSTITVDAVDTVSRRPQAVIFRQGLVTCLINPKAYLFIMAVYPQFMKLQYGSLWHQAAIMGLLTIVMQFAIYGAIALAAATSRDFLLTNKSATIYTGRAAGLLIILAALWTAWEGWRMFHP
jgi:threonine/homoserine/homoserine lactone efflux protein